MTGMERFLLAVVAESVDLSRRRPGMEPAVVVMLDRVVFLGLTSRATLKTRASGGASNRARSPRG